MKKLSLILVSFFLVLKIAYANTYSSDPQIFVKEMVNDAINTLSNKNLSDEEKASFIENLALDNVDINALGLYTLGELRKSADKDSLDNIKKHLKNIFVVIIYG